MKKTSQPRLSESESFNQNVFTINTSIKLNSKDKTTDADVLVISEEARNNTNLPFSDKENLTNDLIFKKKFI